MDTAQVKPFSKAELEHLKEKAMAANVAISIHNEFVNFLRQQHEAPEQEGWILGAKGFEMPVPNQREGMQAPEKPPLASIMDVTSEGLNGVVNEEVERLS